MNPLPGTLGRVEAAFFRFLEWLMVFLLAAMVVMVFGNVVLRYGFNSGIDVSEEMSRYFFVWLTYIGAMVAMREGGHLGVDTLVKHLPGARQEDLPVPQRSADAVLQCAVLLGHLEDARAAGHQRLAGGRHLDDLGLRHRLHRQRGDGLINLHAARVALVTGQVTEDELAVSPARSSTTKPSAARVGR